MKSLHADRIDPAQRRHYRVKDGLAPTVTRILDLAKNMRGGQVRLFLKNVTYCFPEALNDTWPADSPPQPLSGIIELFSCRFRRNTLDRAARDSRQTRNFSSLVTGLEQDLDLVAL